MTEIGDNESHVRRQDTEDLCQIISPPADDTTNHAVSGVIFSREELKQKGECFKHVLDECSVVVSSNTLDSRDGEILDRTVDVATKLAHNVEVRQAIIRRALVNPSFMKHLVELGEDIEGSRASIELSQRADTSARSAVLGDGDDHGKAPRHIRFGGSLRRLFKKLGKRGSQAINPIVNKITACFNVARLIAGKFFRVVKMVFLWIVRAIVDPQGEIREILADPGRSKCMKAIEVIGVVITATIGPLIISFGAAGTSPFGVSASAVGVAATSVAVRRKPRDRESL